MMTFNPLSLGIKACEALMNKYDAEKLPPEGTLFYHQGVFLSGMQNIYLLTGEKRFFDYIKKYVDSVIGASGELAGFVHEKTTESTPELAKKALTMLDHKQPTILLYNLYDETGDPKYMNVIKTVAESMYFWPVNEYGGYWHMMTQPYQMWLDGAYMAGPLSVMYSARFGDTLLRERAVNQIFIMHEHMKDKKTGLYYHGWDCSKKEKWADPVTGLSGQFWGRAVGWYAVAILDIIEYLPKTHPSIDKLKNIEIDLLETLTNFQDKKTGMWFEVLDKTDSPDNWVETSCTCLFIYSFAKAARTEIIDFRKYENIINMALEGLKKVITYDNNGFLEINNICIGTCIDEGTYSHYINRAKIKNDLHGAGAFILMCAELERYNEYLINNKEKEDY